MTGTPDTRLAEAVALLDKRNALALAPFMDARRREAVRIARHYHVEPTAVLARMREKCIACGKAAG